MYVTLEMLFITCTLAGAFVQCKPYYISIEASLSLYSGLHKVNTTLTFWHKHRCYQSTNSSSVLPLLCPETRIPQLVALPSLSYGLGVEGKEEKKTTCLPHSNFSISTDSFAKPLYVYLVVCHVKVNKTELKHFTQIVKMLTAYT